MLLQKKNPQDESNFRIEGNLQNIQTAAMFVLLSWSIVSISYIKAFSFTIGSFSTTTTSTMQSTNSIKTSIQFGVVAGRTAEKRYKLNLVNDEYDNVKQVSHSLTQVKSVQETSVCTELVRDRMERRRCLNCTLSISELWFFRPVGRFPIDRICVHKCMGCGAGRSQCSNCN